MLINSLQPQDITVGMDYGSIKVGNSVFADDVWDLTPYMPSKTTRNSMKHLRFGFIGNDGMKQTVKLYAYHKLGQVKPQSVVSYINSDISRFIKYCEEKGISSFSEVTMETFMDFSFWQKTSRGVSKTVVYKASHVVEDIIRTGQIKGWDVPQKDVLRGITSAGLWKPTKDDGVDKTKPIPDDIFDRILDCAVNREKNILTKAGILIQSQTGMRISEVLSIQEGCIHNGGTECSYMEIKVGKTEKGEPIIHKVYINELVRDAVRELEDYTEELRRESGLKELFITRSSKAGRKATVCKADRFNKERLAPFIRRWDIRDGKGNLYPLKSHQFRATFVKKLVMQKVPIAHVMKQFSHVSVEMTWHYLTLREEEIKEIYSRMLLNPEAKIAGLRAADIRDRLDGMFKGRTEKEVEGIIRNLSNTMSFNPLPNGVCLYDYRRGNCTDGDGCFFYNCPNYITEISFLPILRKELELMEREMERSKMLGMERQWQRQYVKYKYLKPLVESLEVQMNEKE